MHQGSLFFRLLLTLGGLQSVLFIRRKRWLLFLCGCVIVAINTYARKFFSHWYPDKMQLIKNSFSLSLCVLYKACVCSLIYSADTYWALSMFEALDRAPGMQRWKMQFLKIKFLKDAFPLAVHFKGLSYAKYHEKNWKELESFLQKT